MLLAGLTHAMPRRPQLQGQEVISLVLSRVAGVDSDLSGELPAEISLLTGLQV